MFHCQPVIFAFILLSVFDVKLQDDPIEQKARVISDSIIYNLVDSQIFNNSYQFFSFYKDWNNDDPVYLLVYKLKKIPDGFSDRAFTAVELKTDFKLLWIDGLIDQQYLQKDFDQIKIQIAAGKLSKSNLWHKYLECDSIPGKRTNRPIISFRTLVRSEVCQEGATNCYTDSCIYIDPFNGEYIKWGYSTWESCY